MADKKTLEEAVEARRCLGAWFNERPMRPFDHKALVRELMAGFDLLLAERTSGVSRPDHQTFSQQTPTGENDGKA